MSGFFESEIVKESIKEMEEMQQEIIKKTMAAAFAGYEEKKEHLQLMRTFLEKQKNLYFRVSLSNDPEALEMKTRIEEASQLLGYGDVSIHELFTDMEASLDRLEESNLEDTD